MLLKSPTVFGMQVKSRGCRLWEAYEAVKASIIMEHHLITCVILGWALFVTYTIIQSIMRSEMCSLHLTHPSVHTWSSGQPTVQRPGSSRGLPVGAGIRTHNLPLVSGFKSNALSIRPTTDPSDIPAAQQSCRFYWIFYITRITTNQRCF